MKIIKIKQDKNKKTNKKNKVLDENIGLIVNYFKRGKVVIYPTDTIYGLGCMATNKSAINKIYKIKKRSKGKPLLILVSSLAMVKRYCYVSKRQEEYLRNILRPGNLMKNPPTPISAEALKNPPSPPILAGGRPVSVILKSRGVLPKELAGGKDSVAVRLPNSELLVRIIREVNVPIVSTSLNISGRKNLTNISKIGQYFKQNKPDLAVDIGELSSKSSKLVDLTDINNIKILRN